MNTNEENKLRIHTVLGGFRFPMNIDREDEEIYRNAEKQVNRYIDDYQKQYPNFSAEEIRSLVAFQLAVVIYKMETNQSIDPVIEKIRSMDNELEELLNSR
jgi:cell division protein ZapA